MLNAKSFATALTTVWATGYLLCALVAFFLPDTFFVISGSLFHAINIEAIRATEKMTLSSFTFGFIIFAIYVWILSYAVISLYNKFNKVKAV
jgi:membrane protein implicated in regulation of membrane protease activity